MLSQCVFIPDHPGTPALEQSGLELTELRLGDCSTVFVPLVLSSSGSFLILFGTESG